MSDDQMRATLLRLLERTKAAEIDWRISRRPNARYFMDLGNWRLRIESEDGNGEHPFLFSILSRENSWAEVESLRSVDLDRPLTEEERETNQVLRELWESARRNAVGVDTALVEINELLKGPG